MVPPVKEVIRSPHNPRFRQWVRWVERPEAVDCPWLAVEGAKQIRDLCERCRPSQWVLEEGRDSEWREFQPDGIPVCVVSQRLFAKLSRVRSPQGVLSFFEKPQWSWADAGRFVIALDGLQDPGNLGTILRTAAATGLFAVVSSPGTVSPYNAKVVRAAVGALFSTPVLEGEDLASLAGRGYHVWLADPHEGRDLFATPLEPPLAVILGGEGGGIRKGSSISGNRLRIPMAAGIDSLNVAVSSALIMFEAFRAQRREVGSLTCTGHADADHRDVRTEE